MGKKLGEIKTEGNQKLLLMGNPGVGKTVFAASFPGPVLLLDFDSKADSAALFYRDKPELLDQVTVEELGSSLIANPIVELNRILTEELIPQQRAGQMKYGTIILDSITTFSRATLEHIIKTNPGIKRNHTKQGVMPGMQDYGILRREFAKLIPGILSLPCNVIMTAHISTTKDGITEEIVRGPVMDGSFSQELAVYFKEVWVIAVEKEKHIAHTRSNYKYTCRSQIKGLPNPFDITSGYSALQPYITNSN